MIENKIWEEIEKAQNILILSHKSPDGDTLGANIALKIAFKNIFGQQKTITSVCIDPIPEKYYFLPEIDSFVQDFDEIRLDLCVFVDCGTFSLTGFEKQKPGFFENGVKKINIDHHQDNNCFGDINLVDSSAASATAVIYELLKKWNTPISIPISTALLTGLYYDTGSFMHCNTDSKVYRICSDLIKKGANLQSINKNLFFIKPVNRLKLWGLILNRAILTPDKILVSFVKKEDFISTGTTQDDLSGAIDYLNMAREANYCVLLNEKNELVKASLRTRYDNIDVAEIAHKYGGGGHKQAAGFSIPGIIEEEVKWNIKNKDEVVTIV